MASFFLFNDTATTEIYTLSLHDALPILTRYAVSGDPGAWPARPAIGRPVPGADVFLLDGELHVGRSEEHTSELQSQSNLVCRLLLDKKIKPSEKVVLNRLYLLLHIMTFG